MSAAPSGSSSPAFSRRWLGLALIAAAQFMVIMDTSTIGVAVPQMQAELGFSQQSLSWVFNAYVVAFGGLLLLGGRLSDLFGARRTFGIGWLVLAAGSAKAMVVTVWPCWPPGWSTCRPPARTVRSWVDVLPASLMAALGMSLAFIPSLGTAISSAAPREGGLAAGIVNISYQIGSAIGLAAITAVAATLGANGIGNPTSLTDGFSAAFLGAGLIAAAGAVIAAITLLRALRPATGPSLLTRIAEAAAILSASAIAVLQGIDGFTLKHAVDSLASAPPEMHDAAFHDAEIVRWIEWAAAGYFRITLGLTVVLIGAAITRSRALPRWSAALAFVAGLASIADGVVVGTDGFVVSVPNLVAWASFIVFAVTATAAAWWRHNTYQTTEVADRSDGK